MEPIESTEFNQTMPEQGTLYAGQTVTGTRNSYVIEKFLGEGLTSRVYRAHHINDSNHLVAVKALKRDAAPLTQRYFWFEMDILKNLNATAARVYVPQVEDHCKNDGVSFLALTLVDQNMYIPLDKLSEQEPLKELEALQISRQVLFLLNELHTAVGRTYTDMHLDNFRWNRQTQQLLVLDWNHVSPTQEEIQANSEDVQREMNAVHARTYAELVLHDLRRWMSYLYRLVTLKSVSEQGSSESLLSAHAGARWTLLSAGLRGLLARGLSPDQDYCFLDAQTALKAVDNLINFWLDENIDELIGRFKNLLRSAEGNKSSDDGVLKQLDEAAVLLDILERRQAWDKQWITFYRSRLEELTQGVSGDWAVGLRYYNINQFAEAAKYWKQEAGRSHWLRLWRWTLLAQGLEAMSKQGADSVSAKPLAELLVKSLETDNFTAADDARARMVENSSWPDGLRALMDEAHFIREYDTLVDELKSQDIDALKKSEEVLEQISIWLDTPAAETTNYREALKRERGWQDLIKRKNVVQNRINALRLDTNQIEQIAENINTNFDTGLEQMAQLTHTTYLQNLSWLNWVAEMSRQFEAEEPRKAIRILETVLAHTRLSETQTALEMTDHLDQLRVSLALSAPLASLKKSLDESQLFNDLPERARILSEQPYYVPEAALVAPVLLEMKTGLQDALVARDAKRARILYTALCTLHVSLPEEGHKIQMLEFEKICEDVRSALKDENYSLAQRLVNELTQPGTEFTRQAGESALADALQESFQKELSQKRYWSLKIVDEMLTRLMGVSEERQQVIDKLQNAVPDEFFAWAELQDGQYLQLRLEKPDEPKLWLQELERMEVEAAEKFRRFSNNKHYKDWVVNIRSRKNQLKQYLQKIADNKQHYLEIFSRADKAVVRVQSNLITGWISSDNSITRVQLFSQMGLETLKKYLKNEAKDVFDVPVQFPGQVKTAERVRQAAMLLNTLSGHQSALENLQQDYVKFIQPIQAAETLYQRNKNQEQQADVSDKELYGRLQDISPDQVNALLAQMRQVKNSLGEEVWQQVPYLRSMETDLEVVWRILLPFSGLEANTRLASLLSTSAAAEERIQAARSTSSASSTELPKDSTDSHISSLASPSGSSKKSRLAKIAFGMGIAALILVVVLGGLTFWRMNSFEQSQNKLSSAVYATQDARFAELISAQQTLAAFAYANPTPSATLEPDASTVPAENIPAPEVNTIPDNMGLSIAVTDDQMKTGWALVLDQQQLSLQKNGVTVGELNVQAQNALGAWSSGEDGKSYKWQLSKDNVPNDYPVSVCIQTSGTDPCRIIGNPMTLEVVSAPVGLPEITAVFAAEVLNMPATVYFDLPPVRLAVPDGYALKCPEATESCETATLLSADDQTQWNISLEVNHKGVVVDNDSVKGHFSADAGASGILWMPNGYTPDGNQKDTILALPADTYTVQLKAAPTQGEMVIKDLLSLDVVPAISVKQFNLKPYYETFPPDEKSKKTFQYNKSAQVVSIRMSTEKIFYGFRFKKSEEGEFRALYWAEEENLLDGKGSNPLSLVMLKSLLPETLTVAILSDNTVAEPKEMPAITPAAPAETPTAQATATATVTPVVN